MSTQEVASQKGGKERNLVVSFDLQLIIKSVIFYNIQKHVKYESVSAEDSAALRNSDLMRLPGALVSGGATSQGAWGPSFRLQT